MHITTLNMDGIRTKEAAVRNLLRMLIPAVFMAIALAVMRSAAAKEESVEPLFWTMYIFFAIVLIIFYIRERRWTTIVVLIVWLVAVPLAALVIGPVLSLLPEWSFIAILIMLILGMIVFVARDAAPRGRGGQDSSSPNQW